MAYKRNDNGQTLHYFKKPLVEFVNVSFTISKPDFDKGKTPYNFAVGYNKINAVIGINQDLTIDYKKVLVAKGNLCVAIDPDVELKTNSLQFTRGYF